jgi:hypothetical protein
MQILTILFSLLINILLIFVGFNIIWCSISDRKESTSSRLGGLVIGSAMTMIMVVHVNFHFSELRALLIIGSKPSSGCHEPNFEHKKWLPIPCPPPSSHEYSGGK